MSNVWLREDGDGDKRGNYYRSQELVRGFDPILGVNLKGDLNLVSLWNGGSSKEKGQLEMDHDLEDSVMVDLANKILQIPLAREAHEDVQRISWNYLPNLANLRYRRVVVDATCPRCRRADENTDHVFRVCPISVETWINLKLSWILLNTTLSNWEWIAWVFQVGSSEQCRLFCCGLWEILTGRNQLVHERKIASGKDIADWVIKYKGELDGLETRKLTRSGGLDLWKRSSETNIKINFDGAFDLQQKKIGFWGDG
ncbi:hypothetical protein Gotur_019685 [Gossypium turneri]